MQLKESNLGSNVLQMDLEGTAYYYYNLLTQNRKKIHLIHQIKQNENSYLLPSLSLSFSCHNLTMGSHGRQNYSRRTI